jgi:hypothetical protein
MSQVSLPIWLCLPDHFARVFIVPQSDELCMAEMIRAGPLQKLDLCWHLGSKQGFDRAIFQASLVFRECGLGILETDCRRLPFSTSPCETIKTLIRLPSSKRRYWGYLRASISALCLAVAWRSVLD